jgi:hypothetical protein
MISLLGEKREQNVNSFTFCEPGVAPRDSYEVRISCVTEPLRAQNIESCQFNESLNNLDSFSDGETT